MKITKIFGKGGMLVCVALMASGGTYLVTESLYENQIAELQQQLKDLEKVAQKSIVSESVSRQLGEIAKGQFAISERERLNAEKARGEAEEQKDKAQKAEREAQTNAARAGREKREAEKARSEAEQQRNIAQEKTLVAEQARAHADSLRFQALAVSLAQTSLTQSQNGNTELSRLLSYASWHYSSYFNDSVSANKQDIYRALLRSSESFIANGSTGLKGNVRRVRVFAGYVLAVTDYGELFYSDGKKQRHIRLLPKTDKNNYKEIFDIRDFVSSGLSSNCLLCSDGRTYQIDLTGIEGNVSDNEILSRVKEYTDPLPQNTWHKLVKTMDGMVAMGDNMLAWIKKGKVVAWKDFPTQLSCIGVEGLRYLHIFLKNGMHYSADEMAGTPGIVTEGPIVDLKKGEVVTAYTYSDGRHILGLYDGRILITDKNGNGRQELIGHSSPVTDFCVWNRLLGSASYDNTLRLWNMSGLSKTSMVTPVEIKLDRWPLCLDSNIFTGEIWIGTEMGDLPHFCCDLQKNQEATLERLTREFTPEEWNYYIGRDIPWLQFMKKGGEE